MLTCMAYSRFIYGDEDHDVHVDNVTQVLIAAERYQLGPLYNRCLSVLQKAHPIPDPCGLLEVAQRFNEHALKALCLDSICANSQAILTIENVEKLSRDSLGLIVKEDRIAIEEKKLFEIVLDYAKRKCEEQGQIGSTENMAYILGPDIINNIRYPLMDAMFFTDVVEPSGLLTRTYVEQMYRYFCELNSEQPTVYPDFNCTSRRVILTARKYGTTHALQTQMGPSVRTDVLSFKCNQDILIRSVLVFGSCAGPGSLLVNLRLVQEPFGASVCTKNTTLETDGNQEEYEIKLDEPKRLPKEKQFTIILNIDGPPTFQGINGKEQIVTKNTVISFSGLDFGLHVKSKLSIIQGFVYESKG